MSTNELISQTEQIEKQGLLQNAPESNGPGSYEWQVAKSPVVCGRVKPVPITSVIKVELFPAEKPGKHLLSITVMVPFIIREDQITARVVHKNDFSFISHVIDVELFQICSNSEIAVIPTEIPTHLFCIVLPLYITQPKTPLLDRVNLSGIPIVHHTLSINGTILPLRQDCTWRLRFKENMAENCLECVSVTTNFIDLPRVKEGVSTFVGFLSETVGKIGQKFSRRRCQTSKC